MRQVTLLNAVVVLACINSLLSSKSSSSTVNSKYDTVFDVYELYSDTQKYWTHRIF